MKMKEYQQRKQDKKTLLKCKKKSEEAVSNIKDLTDKYNENDKQKTEAFNKNFEEKQKAINDNAEAKTTAFGENAEAQTKTFNTNSDDKLAEYNRNHTAKIKEFDDNYDTKTKTFDDNAAAKLEAYNKNDKTKTDAYNNNASNKEETFNTNAADKQNEFDENASDKLAEYNQNAKELINKVEQVQAENETLKAENKLIKEQIPSASASGNSVHIEDSGTLDFDWKINGGHKQETREGYNLLDEEDCEIGNYSSGSGIPTADSSTYRFNKAIEVKEGETLYFFRQLVILTYDSEENFIEQSTIVQSNNLEYIVPENVKYIRLRTYVSDFDNFKNYKYMISRVKNTAYEKYGVMPLPDYPSEVETVGSNVNYFDKDSVTNEFLLPDSGIAISNDVWRCTDYIEVKNRQYYFSWESDNAYYQVNVCFYDKEKTFLLGKDITKDNVYGSNIDITDNTKYIRISYSVNIGGNPVIRDKIKLEIGNKRTLYSPFMCASVKIDVVNKNLLDKNNEKKGITINTAGVEEANGARSTTQYITVDKNKKVLYVNWSGKTGKQNPGYTILLSYDSNKKLITRQPKYNETSSKNWTFDISNASFIRVTYEDLQVNNGEYGVENTIISYEKTEYEEHQSQTAIMPIQQEMLEGDYVADVEHHEWGKIVLTGNEDGWIYEIDKDKRWTRFARYSLNIDVNSNYLTESICSHFKIFEEYASLKNSFGIEKNNMRFNADSFIFVTVEEWKAYLKQQYEAGTPVTIYYKLATSLDLELTSEQKSIRDTKLYTYKNITNIAVSDKLASIDVEYKKDQDTINKNYENRLAALETASTSEEV